MALTEKHFTNIFIYIIPRFASYGLHLLTLPIFVRILTPEDFGVITLVIALPTIAVSVATAGLTAAVPRFYFEYRKDRTKLDTLYCSSQIYLFLMLLVSTLVVYLTKDITAKIVTGKTVYGQAVFIAYIATYLGNLNTFYLRIYQNMERAALHSSFILFQVITSIALSLTFVWHFHLSYMGMLYGSVAGALITCAILSIHFNRRLKIDFNKVVLLENLKYGLQVVPKSLTSFINTFFDKYMLNAMLSMSAVGVYGIGQRIANVVDVIMDNIWMSFQPAYYREVFDKREIASIDVGRIFTIFCYISLLPVILVVLFANEIIYLIAPPAYYGAKSIVVILAAGTTTQVFGRYASVQYAHSKKPFWILPVVVIGTLFNVGVNILLIPRYGLIGAGFATVASTTITNVIVALLGQKLYRIKYEWKIILMLMGLVVFTMLSTLYVASLRLSFCYIYLMKSLIVLLFILLGIKAGIITKNNMWKLYNILSKLSLKAKV